MRWSRGADVALSGRNYSVGTATPGAFSFSLSRINLTPRSD